MVKKNDTQSMKLCEEISFGKYIFSNVYIIESYANDILEYIIIQSKKWEDKNFSPKEWSCITVKYSAKEKSKIINSYMADIAFAEVTSEGNLKLNIESSGFYPTIGNGVYLG